MVHFPDEALTAETVIVSGPPMTGESRLFHHLLAQRGEAPIVIATGVPAGEFREQYTEVVGSEATIQVVDCISRGRGKQTVEDATTRYVDSPGNLTAIGVKVTEFIEAKKDAQGVVVGVHSLSQMLMHAGLQQTYQFIHILAQQAAAADVPLIAVVNDRAHEEQTLNAIYERFDCLIETRTTDGSNEFRTRTSMREPSDWIEV